VSLLIHAFILYNSNIYEYVEPFSKNSKVLDAVETLKKDKDRDVIFYSGGDPPPRGRPIDEPLLPEEVGGSIILKINYYYYFFLSAPDRVFCRELRSETKTRMSRYKMNDNNSCSKSNKKKTNPLISFWACKIFNYWICVHLSVVTDY